MRRMYGIRYTVYLPTWMALFLYGKCRYQLLPSDPDWSPKWSNIQKGREQKNLARVVGVDSARFMLFKTTKNTKPWNKWWIQLIFWKNNSLAVTATKSETEPMVCNEIQFLVGGNSNISYFHPVTLGRWFNLTYSIFSKWVGEKPPTLKNGPKKCFLERLPSVLFLFGQQLDP